MTRIAALLGAVLAVGATTACSVGFGAAAGQQPASLLVGVAGDPRYACFQAARDLGVFDRYQLSVRLVELDPAMMPAALAGGRVDLAGIDSAAAVYSAGADPDLRIVSIYATSPDYVKLVRSAAAAVRPGAPSIAVVASSPSEAASDHLAEHADVDVGVEVVDGSPQDAVRALAAGSAASALLWEPWASDVTKAGGSVIATGSGIGYQDQQVVAVQARWLAGHQDAVRRFNEALGSACRHAATAHAWSSTFHFGVRAPLTADSAEYALELADHSRQTIAQMQPIADQLIRGDLVPSADVLAPGCDCQRVPSPLPSSAS